MAKKIHPQTKLDVLRQHRCVNPHPEMISDPLFADRDFFDPLDLLQVKYEMLRRVLVDGQSVAQSAAAFGFSRPLFYRAQAAFLREGLAGLLPKKRGPRTPRKLTPPVMAFLDQEREREPLLNAEELAARVKQRFALEVHPRSIERAFARQKKTHL